MGVYSLTYMSGGNEKLSVKSNFSTDDKANDFCKLFNSKCKSGRIIQVTRVISQMSEKDKNTFLNQSFNPSQCSNLKVKYNAGVKKSFNNSIPFCDNTFTMNDVKALMIYINDFIKVENVIVKNTIYK